MRNVFPLGAKDSLASLDPGQGEKTVPVAANQPKRRVREKKTRCISFWVSESEYWEVLELAMDETAIAAIGRKALRRFVENARKGKQ